MAIIAWSRALEATQSLTVLSATGPATPSELGWLAEQQAGVLTRAQARIRGLSRSAVHRRVAKGSWRRVHPGVYTTWPGPPSVLTKVWAALLYAGEGAMASHATAAWLDGFAAEPAVIDITIPGGRRVRPRPGVRIHRSAAAERRRHPSKLPPRTRLEDTVIDLAELAAHIDDVMAIVSRVCRQRLTTADRIAATAASRTKIRRRHELAAILSDVADGTQAVLEHRYLTRVERAHGLPAGTRQLVVRRGARTEYKDVGYDQYGLIVELDGPVGHSDDVDRLRDMRRDNADLLAGWIVLRFGFSDVTRRPCAVAEQVCLALTQRGWNGSPRRCGPSCELPTP